MHRKIIKAMNAPRLLCDIAIGKDHKPIYRYVSGLLLMVIGVCLSKTFSDNHLLHIPSDLVGYGVHGMGLTPFIEFFHKD